PPAPRPARAPLRRRPRTGAPSLWSHTQHRRKPAPPRGSTTVVKTFPRSSKEAISGESPGRIIAAKRGGPSVMVGWPGPAEGKVHLGSVSRDHFKGSNFDGLAPETGSANPVGAWGGGPPY